MICKFCSFEITSEKAKFCPKCGLGLSNVCTCGASFLPGAIFCTECGSKRRDLPNLIEGAEETSRTLLLENLLGFDYDQIFRITTSNHNLLGPCIFNFRGDYIFVHDSQEEVDGVIVSNPEEDSCPVFDVVIELYGITDDDKIIPITGECPLNSCNNKGEVKADQPAIRIHTPDASKSIKFLQDISPFFRIEFVCPPSHWKVRRFSLNFIVRNESDKYVGKSIIDFQTTNNNKKRALLRDEMDIEEPVKKSLKSVPQCFLRGIYPHVGPPREPIPINLWISNYNSNFKLYVRDSSKNIFPTEIQKSGDSDFFFKCPPGEPFTFIEIFLRDNGPPSSQDRGHRFWYLDFNMNLEEAVNYLIKVMDEDQQLYGDHNVISRHGISRQTSGNTFLDAMLEQQNPDQRQLAMECILYLRKNNTKDYFRISQYFRQTQPITFFANLCEEMHKHSPKLQLGFEKMQVKQKIKNEFHQTLLLFQMGSPMDMQLISGQEDSKPRKFLLLIETSESGEVHRIDNFMAYSLKDFSDLINRKIGSCKEVTFYDSQFKAWVTLETIRNISYLPLEMRLKVTPLWKKEFEHQPIQIQYSEQPSKCNAPIPIKAEPEVTLVTPMPMEPSRDIMKIDALMNTQDKKKPVGKFEILSKVRNYQVADRNVSPPLVVCVPSDVSASQEVRAYVVNADINTFTGDYEEVEGGFASGNITVVNRNDKVIFKSLKFEQKQKAFVKDYKVYRIKVVLPNTAYKPIISEPFILLSNPTKQKDRPEVRGLLKQYNLGEISINKGKKKDKKEDHLQKWFSIFGAQSESDVFPAKNFLLALDHHLKSNFSCSLQNEDQNFLLYFLRKMPRTGNRADIEFPITTEPDIVQFTQWELLSLYFGPLKDLLNKIRLVYRCSFFHGFLSTQEAEKLLYDQPHSVLVRLSEECLFEGGYIISYYEYQDNTVYHCKTKYHSKTGKHEVDIGKVNSSFSLAGVHKLEDLFYILSKKKPIARERDWMFLW